MNQSNQIARSNNDKLAPGLSLQLFFLTIGCRVMFRANLWTGRGLEYFAHETIKVIVYFSEFQPQAVMLHFDGYHGPFLIERLFVIEHISKY